MFKFHRCLALFVVALALFWPIGSPGHAQSAPKANAKAQTAKQTAAKPGTVAQGAPFAAKMEALAAPILGPTGKAPAPDATDTSLLTAVPLKITLTPSENPIKLGSTSNIAADILNVSNRPVEVDTTTIQLMTHAILSQTDTLCVLPLGPTTNTTIMGPMILQPQDHLSVLFNLSQKRLDYSPEEQAIVDSYFKSTARSTEAPAQAAAVDVQRNYQKVIRTSYNRSCDPQFFGPIKRALDFSPGNYEYYLTGKFSVCDPNVPNYCPNEVRSFAQSASFPVGIDQTQIIIFAIVGGLLAYLVVTVRSEDGALNHFFEMLKAETGLSSMAKLVSKEGIVLMFKVLRDIIGVAIMSSAFTIVSSRLADTQFPIKISVLDVWGAITIGFLSYFAGNKFIDSLRGTMK
jgi:hypothetical protein